jgi:hypothetical protein
MVEDASGARIPNAAIRLINAQSGTESDSTTSRYGLFLLPGVIPGSYALEIERNGFATIQITGLTLTVGETRSLLIRMQVGSVKQTVKIEASAMALEAGDAAVSTVVDQTFVADIPLNGRSFQDLISMTPGIVPQTPQGSGGRGGDYGDFSVNGQQPENNSYMVDGVSANIGLASLARHQKLASTGDIAGSTALGTTQSLVSVDALQEFRVLGSSYSAEYGREAGGQFSLLTRSGTDTVHGSFFDYVRNNDTDAADWFTRFYSAGALPPQVLTPYHQNDLGGTLGGAAIIPGLYNGVDRTFFFLSYEGLRVKQPTGPLVQFVPSNTLYQEAPLALQPVLSAFAVNGSFIDLSAASTGLLPFVSNPTSYPDSVDAISVRVDHIFSPRLSTFIRYSDTPSDSQSGVLASLTVDSVHTQTVTLGATAQFSAGMDDDLRIGYAGNSSSLSTELNNHSSSGMTSLGTSLNTWLGIPAGTTSASADAYVHVIGAGGSKIDTDDASGSLHQWDLRDTLTSQIAHHLVRLGFDERHIVSVVNPPSLTVEADFFDEASMLENLASDVSITRSLPATPVFDEFSAFVQDEWHVFPSLTLSAGLRWELEPAPQGKDGQDAYTLLGTLSSPALLRLAPRGTPLWQTSWVNLAPRFGAAWSADKRPGRELALRGGAGVFFDTDNRAAAEAFSALGFSATSHPENVPVPVTSEELDFSASSSAPYTSTIAFAFPRHLQLPYLIQWNVSAEKALGKNQALTTSWVGAAGRRLLMERRTNVSAENPEFGEVGFFPGGITSNYRAFQAKFQRSVSPGIQALASYTWSQTFDYGCTDPAWPLTYSNSDFDVRQNLEAAVSWSERRLPGNWLRRNILGGWGADGRLTVRTAFPVTPLGNLFSDPATGNRYYSGVDLVRGRPLYLYGSQYPGGRMFNGGPNAANPAFVLPVVLAAGDAPRNLLRGFGDEQVNVALRREIPLRDHFGLQLRAETYNLFNHPDLGYIDPAVTDALFGQATLMLNQSFGPTGSLYEPGGPRSIQVSLRIHF